MKKDYWLVVRSLFLILILYFCIIPFFQFEDFSHISTIDEISSGSDTTENDLNKFSEKPLLLDSVTTNNYANGSSVVQNNKEAGESPAFNQKMSSNLETSSNHPFSTNSTRILGQDECIMFDPTNLAYPAIYEYKGGNDWDITAFETTGGQHLLMDIDSGDIDNDGQDELVAICGPFFNSVGGEYTEHIGVLLYTYELADGVWVYVNDPIGLHWDFLQYPVDNNYGGGDEYDIQLFAGAISLGDGIGTGIENTFGVVLTGHADIHDSIGYWHCIEYVYTAFGGWNDELRIWGSPPHYHNQANVENNDADEYFYSVAAEWGDFDRDGIEEFMYATNRFCNIWELNFPLVPSLLASPAMFFGPYYTQAPFFTRLAVGDFNGDSYPEAAVSTNNIIFVFEYEIATSRVVMTNQLPVNTFHTYPEALHASDINQDGRDEILIFGWDASNYWAAIIWVNPTTNIYELKLLLYPFLYSGVWSSIGDLDADGWDEIVFSSATSRLILDDARTNFTMMNSWTAFSGIVQCGNFNGNGLTLSYTGDIIETEQSPGVLVAIAAPPTRAGISQAYSNSYTCYGKEVEGVVVETNSVGFSVGSQISYEAAHPDLNWVASVSISHSWEEEFEKTNTKSSTSTIATYAAGGHSDNTIIYFLVKFKSYGYEVIDHPFNQSLIGSLMYISIPETPLVYTVSQTYFNTHYNSCAIGTETFNHTFGDPTTYPMKEDLATIAPLRWCTPIEFETPVGQGNQYDAIIISKEEFQSTGMESTTTSTWSFGFQIFGLSFDKSYSTSNSKGYEIGSAEGCSYEGRVGQIEDFKEYEKYKYSFGMFLYHKTNSEAGNTYLVINYYVNDLGNSSIILSSTMTEPSSTSTTTPFLTPVTVILYFTILVLVLQKYKKK